MPDFGLLFAATRVLVTNGRSYDEVLGAQRKKRRQRKSDDGRVLLDERDAARVHEIAQLLGDTVPGANAMDWMERQQILFVFLGGGRVIREIGLLSGAAWSRDGEFYDLPLQEPCSIDRWLLAGGVDLPSPPQRGD